MSSPVRTLGEWAFDGATSLVGDLMGIAFLIGAAVAGVWAGGKTYQSTTGGAAGKTFGWVVGIGVFLVVVFLLFGGLQKAAGTY